MKQFLLMPLLLCSAASAGQVDLMPVDPDAVPYSSIERDDVIAYHGTTNEPFIEIGVLVAHRNLGESDTDLVVQLKEKAAMIGADALLFVGFGPARAEAVAVKRIKSAL